MLRRNWTLIALCYLVFAEILSWGPVPDLSLCLIQPEHSDQAADHNNRKYCPAFHIGMVVALEALDGVLERHDKSVVGGFTIVLAISTIGLWLATNRLWIAGERQISLAEEAAAASSVGANTLLALQRAQVFLFQWHIIAISNGPSSPVTGYGIRAIWKNYGQSPATQIGVFIHPPIPMAFGSDEDTIPVFEFNKTMERVGNLPPGEQSFSIFVQMPVEQALLCWERKIRMFFFAVASHGDIFDPSARYFSHDCAEIVFHADPSLKRSEEDLRFLMSMRGYGTYQVVEH